MCPFKENTIQEPIYCQPQAWHRMIHTEIECAHSQMVFCVTPIALLLEITKWYQVTPKEY